MSHYDYIMNTRRRINGVPMTSIGDAARLFTEADERREREYMQEMQQINSQNQTQTIIAEAIGDAINNAACIFADKLSDALVSNIGGKSESEVVNVEELPDGSRKITLIER